MEVLRSDNSPRNMVIRKLEAEKIEPSIIKTFLFYYDQLLAGNNCMIQDRDIEPVDPENVLLADHLTDYEKTGQAVADRCVRIVLNGGLGTSMGLTGPKSLLKVKNSCSFLETILAQTAVDNGLLCLMNSFNTHRQTLSELLRIGPSVLPMTFLQHKFPKILQSNFHPASWPEAPHLEWNPPGHGDIYISLYTSGLLKRLLDRGVRYAFISNSDNLGATLDMSLLGFFSEKNIPFMMEVAQRQLSDAKGGHLARYRSEGRLVLRESAQCPSEEKNVHQDIGYYRYFNTNNIWINLLHLQEVIDRDGIVKLPMILNPKALDPRDENSPSVFQVETAMGAAISLFDGAVAVHVPRTRFFPVKTCSDLLVLRSDRFILEEDRRLLPNPHTQTDMVSIDLDPAWFRNIDDFDKRFRHGVPSLLGCESLTVVGDVYFEGNVTIIGEVTITNTRESPAVVPGGSVLDRDVSF